MGGKKADNTPLSIAIVGAGFGGLSLAIALKNAGISTTIFEAQSGKAGGIFGDLFLPNGKQSMKELGLSDMWNGLTKRTAGRPNYVPQENLQRAMREVASDCIRYNNRVLRVEQEKTGGYLNCVIGKEKKYRGNSIKEIFEGPFDIVVGADGVLSRFRHCVGCSSRVAILGDARWVQDRFDLGMQRIRCGADIAIRDGIELARILSAEGTKSMGRFCAARKRQEILTRRGNILTAALVAILARTSYPFEGQSLVAALFVSALIHLGGKIRFQLPSISSIPVTLHTLSACCAGLIFGPYIGAFGGGLYALLWTIFHVYTRPRQEVTSSWGYIFGMIPCSIVSGGLYDEGNHPMLAAVVGQSCTLLMGALWLIVVTDDDAKKNPFDVIRGGVLPFLPGLVIKSFVAWRIQPIHREYTSTE